MIFRLFLWWTSKEDRNWKRIRCQEQRLTDAEPTHFYIYLFTFSLQNTKQKVISFEKETNKRELLLRKFSLYDESYTLTCSTIPLGIVWGFKTKNNTWILFLIYLFLTSNWKKKWKLFEESVYYDKGGKITSRY